MKSEIKNIITSTDSVDDEKTTKNPSAEKCDSYNPDDEAKYQDMISAAVEMKILSWEDVILSEDEHDKVLNALHEDMSNNLRRICQHNFLDHCNDQDSDWYKLSLPEKVAQYVNAKSYIVIHYAQEAVKELIFKNLDK